MSLIHVNSDNQNARDPATKCKSKDKQASKMININDSSPIKLLSSIPIYSKGRNERQSQFTVDNLSLDTACIWELYQFQVFRQHSNPVYETPVCEHISQSHTVSLISGLTSIMPLSRDWQSGGMKWGMWNTPLFTFSRSWRKLSWSKGRAPCMRKGERE